MPINVHHIVGNLNVDMLPQELDNKEPDKQYKSRVELLALPYLALLSGILALLGCWFLGFLPIRKKLEIKIKVNAFTARLAGQPKFVHTSH